VFFKDRDGLCNIIACLSLVVLVATGCEKKPAGGAAPAGGDAGGTAQPGTGEGSGAATATTPPGGKTKLDPASVTDGGSVTGTVTLTGSAPTPTAVNMQAKPECAALHTTQVPAENLLVGDGGGLKDVFVQISGGLESYDFDPPSEPAVIDQKGCIYIPHVFGISVGQDLEIRNSDEFLHNVKVNDNHPLNLPMTKPGTLLKEEWFKREGVPTTFQCEVHPWMRAYACVVDHPYYAVTVEDGKFTIDNLPAGKYKVSVWHEVFPGLKAPAEQEVEVKAGEAATVNFEYSI